MAQREGTVGARQHRTVVEAVTDHGQPATLLLQLEQLGELALGTGLSDHDLLDAKLARHALGGRARSPEQAGLEPELMQPRDHGGGLFPHPRRARRSPASRVHRRGRRKGRSATERPARSSSASSRPQKPADPA